MLANFINIVLSGVALGMLLFLISGGLSVVMGLMGFANMAHCSFAMLGGYIAATLVNDVAWPFLLALPVAALATAAVGAVFERLIFRRLYKATELEQVLLTIGLVFMSVAAANYVFGSVPVNVPMPRFLSGHVAFALLDVGAYQLFLIGFGGVLVTAMILGIQRTNFGAKIRAAVDNRRMTTSSGINVDRLFILAFALGTGLAGLGGALSINLLGLDPVFPLRYLVLTLLVVVVGGLGSVQGTLISALLLGVGDVVGKYYVHEAGAFFIYAIPVMVLLMWPTGLFGKR